MKNRTTYQNEHTENISFPLGGIGSGSIGLAGNGMLIDWEIFNRPSKGSRNGYSHFAIKAKNSQGIQTKILNGDLTKDLAGQYRKQQFSGFGYGGDSASMCGFPHFKNVIFHGEFPIARLEFSDPVSDEGAFPGNITMTAFNPFIPLDADNSSIPAAFFEILVENNTRDEVEYQVAFSVKNPFPVSENCFSSEKIACSDAPGTLSMITLKHAGVSKDHISYGDLTVATDHEDVSWQSYWYRGGWQDAIVTYWNDMNREGDLKERLYDTPGKGDLCTLAAKVTLGAGEQRKVRFLLSWNVPNNYCYWVPDQEHLSWKNYYAVLFRDSAASASYAFTNWDSLYRRTYRFKELLFGTTIDPILLEAASATLSVLKTATVLRLEDGSFYGWEGVHEEAGSCEGTCQHVWNYAYALCFLFPELERSIRDLEFQYSTDPDGRMVFRLKLPLGREKGDFRACLDGQMGHVIKCYREWKLSGDDQWLIKNWNNISSVLEYTWSPSNPDQWDPDKDGVLEGRQHHTLDMEMFGPSSWLQSMYLAALEASAEMADYLGHTEKAAEYREIFTKGYHWTKENLFNGSYFFQQIDLKNKAITEHFGCTEEYWNEEAQEIKYQIAQGSEIDQLLGQWHCVLNGLGDVFDKEQRRQALQSMMKNQYKDSMRTFANPWRIFSLNDEAGTVMCDYPEGVYKPAIPIPYCEETMHGFEYAFAGLLFSEGYFEDGLKVVKAVRDKYDGKKRNPWNEIECGSNYARSMASFAFLPILSGFEFHLPKKYLGFYPKVNQECFRCLFSVGTGWGSFSLTGGPAPKAQIALEEGFLTLSSLGLPHPERIQKLTIDGKEKDFYPKEEKLFFEETVVKETITVVYTCS